jgi:hypothetical protein
MKINVSPALRRRKRYPENAATILMRFSFAPSAATAAKWNAD